MLRINTNPDRRTLRRFGFVALAGFGVLGVILWWRNGLLGVDLGAAARPTAVVLWGLGAASALLGSTCPSANRPLWVGLSLLTYPIGFVVSHLALALVFFGLLTPIGIVFRLMRRDPLHRRFDRTATTYWVARAEKRDVRRYFQQF